MSEVNQKTGKPYSQDPAAVAQRARNEARGKKWDASDYEVRDGKKVLVGDYVPGVWQTAYETLRDQFLSSKTCEVAGCPCEGKGKAERFVKVLETADLSSPSATHSAGEFAWMLLNAVPACSAASTQKKGRVKKVDRVASALEAHIAEGGATDEDTLKSVMEGV